MAPGVIFVVETQSWYCLQQADRMEATQQGTWFQLFLAAKLDLILVDGNVARTKMLKFEKQKVQLIG